MKSEFRLPLVHNKDWYHYCAFERIMSFTASILKIAENLEAFTSFLYFCFNFKCWIRKDLEM